MAQNVLEQASADVAAQAHDPGAMAQTLERHAGTPMYVAEVVSLLQQRHAWDAVKNKVGHDLAHDGENNAKTINAAVNDANGAVTDKNKIRLDITGHHDPFYGERYLARLHELRNLRIITKIDDTEGLFRSRAGRSLGMAELDGLISGADVVTLGIPRFVQGGSGKFDPLTGVAESIEEAPTDNAKHNLENAQKELASLDNELQHQLREIGPAIWDPNEHDQAKIAQAQRRVRNYIADFKSSARYRKAQNDVRTASNALHVQITANELDIEAHGKDTNAAGAAKHGLEAIVHSYRDLAASPGHAVEAVRWAKQHEGDKEYASFRGQITEISELGQTTDANVRVQTLAQILRADDSSKEAVKEAIKMIDETVIKPYDAIQGVRGIRELKGALAEISAHIAEFRARNAKQIEQLGALVIHATADGDPIARRIGSAFGMMITVVEDRKKLVVTTDFVAIGDNVTVLYQKIDTFKKTIDKGLHDKGKITSEAKDVHGKFLVLSRIMGPIALAANAYGVSEDISELRDDGNPAVAVKLVGDIASTVGSAIALFPPLAPIGDTIGLLGAAISLIASGFVGDPAGDRRRDDERGRLIRINAFDHGPHQTQLASTFTDKDSAGELQDAESLHLTLDQIKQLAAKHPYLFTSPHMLQGADALRKFLGDPTNTKHGIGGLVSPYKDNLYAFLINVNPKHDDLMGVAIRNAMHGSIGTQPDNLVMVKCAREALPKDAFSGPVDPDVLRA
jgi:hypothetical protein